MAHLKSTTAYVYDNLNAPVGTKMVFNQTASPLGWTKSTSSNDVSLRLVSGTVGTGGTVAFETCFASHTPTISTPTISAPSITMSNAGTTIGVSTMPSHNHGYLYNDGVGGPTNSIRRSTYSAGYKYIDTTGGGGSHSHGNSATSSAPTSSQPTSSAIDLNVSYVDVIIATKD